LLRTSPYFEAQEGSAAQASNRFLNPSPALLQGHPRPATLGGETESIVTLTSFSGRTRIMTSAA
jgi:hypothetical protein